MAASAAAPLGAASKGVYYELTFSEEYMGVQVWHKRVIFPPIETYYTQKRPIMRSTRACRYGKREVCSLQKRRMLLPKPTNAGVYRHGPRDSYSHKRDLPITPKRALLTHIAYSPTKETY